MRFAVARMAIWTVFLVATPCSVLAQQGLANHNVILRRDPSTSSPALAHLQKGARLALVDSGPDSGFYHVRTEDDQVGWVFAKYIALSQAAAAPLSSATSGASAECDANLWSHVYHPQRLIVKSPCASVTGTIVDATNGKRHDGVRHEADGDTHGWLKLDPEFESLLDPGNISDEGGNLVFEIVCRFPVTQADAKTACLNYTDHVTLPPVGSHVRIVGTYVQDTFHAKWMEIHPVTSITVIP
jgi:hypothetical protein